QGNPLKYVDPDGNEIGAAYDAWDSQLATGALSLREHQARVAGSAEGNAVGAGAALLTASAFAPGPEDVVLGFAARSGGMFTRIGSFFTRFLSGAGDTARATNRAYQAALDGGKHAGTLRNYAARSTDEIARGVRGYERNVAEHVDK